ncbi:hypothetical protein HMPREF0322_02782 [Desulfitobacterium hafniense DP7]|uniref:DUF7479 domain-containing protein n=2 Tax=Desulfitobacterium TaxID=36853 RepID=A0A1M7UFQ8_9FIRM|nr:MULTISPECIES: CLJU_RS11820 family redox protein [Desulfitobacterium]EHL06512.1 hypothetical protein HMPREF0322_02782 [Desulfitobacterium hafniense DP7]SHN81833.1 hypothetical protein SAMN02745215_03673 [Desulfitobacterium chlororespirans DSM 11544]
MSKTENQPQTVWKCGKCNVELSRGTIVVAYLGNEIRVEELKCAQCGLVLITEDLALGKMFEVEQSLEDK